MNLENPFQTHLSQISCVAHGQVKFLYHPVLQNVNNSVSF